MSTANGGPIPKCQGFPRVGQTSLRGRHYSRQSGLTSSPHASWKPTMISKTKQNKPVLKCLRTGGHDVQESTEKNKIEDKSFKEVKWSKRVPGDRRDQNQERVKWKQSKQEHRTQQRTEFHSWLRFTVFKSKSFCIISDMYMHVACVCAQDFAHTHIQ